MRKNSVYVENPQMFFVKIVENPQMFLLVFVENPQMFAWIAGGSPALSFIGFEPQALRLYNYKKSYQHSVDNFCKILKISILKNISEIYGNAMIRRICHYESCAQLV